MSYRALSCFFQKKMFLLLFKTKTNTKNMHESAGYPSSSTKLSEENWKKLINFPKSNQGTESLNVKWFQENVWQETASFHIPPEEVICGMQANIFKIILKNDSGSSTYSVIGKRVVPNELPAKANLTIWKDFLDSAQRETEFYQNLKPDIQHLFPKVFYSDGFQDENDLMESFYLMLLEDVSENYYQNTSMGKCQAEDLMKCLAELHASYWGHYDSNKVTRGTFWVLSRRQPLGEIENADQTWKNLLSRFPQFENLNIPDIQQLGQKLSNKAQFLDDHIASNLFTLVHGDCKGWNIFFKKESCGHRSKLSPVLFIDMQWAGIGNPLQDVAYSLTTTLEPELLNSMDQFVDIYIKHLLNLMSTSGNPEEEKLIRNLKQQFDLVWLDYARVIITGLWKRFSPEIIEKNKTVVGPSMIGRSILHAEFIIKKISHLLNDANVDCSEAL